MTALTKRYRRAQADLDDAGKAAMAKALEMLRADIPPTEVARLSPFTDSYIRKAAREAGIGPAREPRGITAAPITRVMKRPPAKPAGGQGDAPPAST